MLVVNLIGPPSSGKSVLRADLFSYFKKQGKYRVEEIHEYAKLLTYKNPEELKNQFQVSAIQEEWQKCLIGKVDLAITDSPILLGAIYDVSPTQPQLEYYLVNRFNTYNNLNFVLPYVYQENYGRLHNVEESKQISEQLYKLVAKYKIPYTSTNLFSSITHLIEQRLKDDLHVLHTSTEFLTTKSCN
jgi:tRNA uridine 5-carbamoylmethylation protein Kti12